MVLLPAFHLSMAISSGNTSGCLLINVVKNARDLIYSIANAVLSAPPPPGKLTPAKDAKPPNLLANDDALSPACTGDNNASER